MIGKPTCGNGINVYASLRIAINGSEMLDNGQVKHIAQRINSVYSHLLTDEICLFLCNSLYQRIGVITHPTQGPGRSSAHVPFPHYTHQSHVRINVRVFGVILIHDSFRLDHTPSDRVGSVSEIALPLGSTRPFSLNE